MTILAIDYGRRWIGLAIGSSETRFAFPFQTLTQSAFLFEELRTVCHKEGVKQIVIGLPRIWRGNLTLQDEIRAFAGALGDFLSLPITFAEELFTSRIAHMLSPAGAEHSVHAQSAALILENYFVATSN